MTVITHLARSALSCGPLSTFAKGNQPTKCEVLAIATLGQRYLTQSTRDKVWAREKLEPFARKLNRVIDELRNTIRMTFPICSRQSGPDSASFQRLGRQLIE
jgi:hypothetical protein